MKVLRNIFILFLIFLYLEQADTQPKQFTTYYRLGIEALSNQDTLKAEKYFKRSALRYKDAASYFELGKIYSIGHVPYRTHFALLYLKKAVYKDPENIDYRLALARINKRMSRMSAIREYERLLDVDNSCALAWLELGKLRAAEFNEYHKSAHEESGILLSLEDFAQEDFMKAVHCFKQAIYLDSTAVDPLLHVAFLYEDAGLPENGIPYLKNLAHLDPENDQAQLFLGLLYYKTRQLDASHEAFTKAIDLMSINDQQEFTYYSMKSLLEPIIKHDQKLSNDPQALKRYLNLYWKANDPFYLSDYNERLLEHYSRVAYANLRFSIPKMGIKGWHSDRGQTVIRFGEPKNRLRLRPSMDMNSIKMKTEIWNYGERWEYSPTWGLTGMVFAFTDEFFNGNFRFTVPAPARSKFQSQYYGNSHAYFEALKNKYHQLYNPVFEGPNIELPYTFVQFADPHESKNRLTDIYINYAINLHDTLNTSLQKQYAHEHGIFFLDGEYNPIYESKAVDTMLVPGHIVKNNQYHYVINSDHLKVIPTTWFFAFETRRFFDKAIFSNHKKIAIQPFSTYQLAISDVVLAHYISAFEKEGTTLTRNGIYILPNPLNRFMKEQDLHIYFEIYNLRPGANGSSQFEQRIELRELQDKNEFILKRTFKSLIDAIGIGSPYAKVILSSENQTPELNPQIYLQLDMSKYEPGIYQLTITINDRISGSSASSQTQLVLED